MYDLVFLWPYALFCAMFNELDRAVQLMRTHLSTPYGLFVSYLCTLTIVSFFMFWYISSVIIEHFHSLSLLVVKVS